MYELKVGAAKHKLTPPLELLPYPVPAWFGGGRYSSVHKDIYVRSLAINNGEKTVLFIVGELGTFLNANVIEDRLMEKFGLDRSNIMICATHNHEAPEGKLNPDINEEEILAHEKTSEELEIEEKTKVFSEYIASQSVRAATDAINSMVPAKYGFGKGESYINVNRDEEYENGTYDMGSNFARPSDKTLSVIKFEDMNGRQIAVFINYAMHNNACYNAKDKDGRDLMVYGDVSGEVCDFLEERYKDNNTVALWFIGAAGNQNPIYHHEHSRINPDGSHTYLHYKLGYGVWDACRYLGERQATDVIKILKGLEADTDTAKLTVARKMYSLPGTKVVGYTREMIRNSDKIDYSKISNAPSGQHIPLELALVTLGDIAFYFINGEVMCETGMRLKEHSPLKNTVICSMFGNNPAGKYMVDDWGYDHKTFAYFRNTIEKGAAERCMMENLDLMLKERQAQ